MDSVLPNPRHGAVLRLSWSVYPSFPVLAGRPGRLPSRQQQGKVGTAEQPAWSAVALMGMWSLKPPRVPAVKQALVLHLHKDPARPWPASWSKSLTHGHGSSSQSLGGRGRYVPIVCRASTTLCLSFANWSLQTEASQTANRSRVWTARMKDSQACLMARLINRDGVLPLAELQLRIEFVKKLEGWITPELM